MSVTYGKLNELAPLLGGDPEPAMSVSEAAEAALHALSRSLLDVSG